MDNAAMKQSPPASSIRSGGRTKFIVGGILLLAAVLFLIISNLSRHAEYFMTIHELNARQEDLVGRNVRISGAVVGDSIEYGDDTLAFTIVNIPDSAAEIETGGGLARVLHDAVTNPDAERVQVVLYNEPKPDLLQDEAQAIVTGTLGDDGVFYADELLLKCPTRYEEALPEQAEEELS
jgi:cytochrome c-type biogenesis protein CcmE